MATVLVVDDNQMVLSEVCEALTHMGHTVLRATNGAEAVASAEERHVDVVLMDLVMPVLDGIEAIRELRALLPGLPVIATSNGAWAPAAGRLEAAREAGARLILPKPFDHDALRDAIEACLGVQR